MISKNLLIEKEETVVNRSLEILGRTVTRDTIFQVRRCPTAEALWHCGDIL